MGSLSQPDGFCVIDQDPVPGGLLNLVEERERGEKEGRDREEMEEEVKENTPDG